MCWSLNFSWVFYFLSTRWHPQITNSMTIIGGCGKITEASVLTDNFKEHCFFECDSHRRGIWMVVVKIEVISFHSLRVNCRLWHLMLLWLEIWSMLWMRDPVLPVWCIYESVFYIVHVCHKSVLICHIWIFVQVFVDYTYLQVCLSSIALHLNAVEDHVECIICMHMLPFLDFFWPWNGEDGHSWTSDHWHLGLCECWCGCRTSVNKLFWKTSCCSGDFNRYSSAEEWNFFRQFILLFPW